MIAFDANLGTNTGDAASTTITLTTAAQAANNTRIIVYLGWANAGVTPSISGGGLTWIVDRQFNSGSFSVAMVSADAPAGLASGTVLTVTYSASAQFRMVSAASFTGVVKGTSGYVDATAGVDNGLAAGWSSGSISTIAGDLITALDWADGFTNTPTSPSTELHEFTTPSVSQVTEYRIESAAGSYSVAGTWTTAPLSASLTVLVAYKQDVVAPIILFDAASSSGYEASLSTYGWSHVCSGSYRGLLVSVSVLATGTVSSVTYAGVGLVFVRADVNGVYRNEIWKLESPTLGSNTVTVNLSASLTSIASAISYTGVDQTNMIDAQAGANGSGGTPTANLTNITDKAWIFSGISTADPTTSPDQTQRTNNTGALGSGATSDNNQPVSPPALTTMSWATVGVTDSWGLSLIAIKPDVSAFRGVRDSIPIFIGPF